jgi:hypothetical protein
MEAGMRRIVIAVTATVSATLLVLGATSMINYHFVQCDETVAFDSFSPDGQWLAEAMERRFSDDSPLVIHINVSPYGNLKFPGYLSRRIDGGEVFAVEQGNIGTELALEWNGPRQLTIRCPNCRPASVLIQKSHAGPVTLSYQLPSN